jgi:hypothetical protein
MNNSAYRDDMVTPDTMNSDGQVKISFDST